MLVTLTVIPVIDLTLTPGLVVLYPIGKFLHFLKRNALSGMGLGVEVLYADPKMELVGLLKEASERLRRVERNEISQTDCISNVHQYFNFAQSFIEAIVQGFFVLLDQSACVQGRLLGEIVADLVEVDVDNFTGRNEGWSELDLLEGVFLA